MFLYSAARSDMLNGSAMWAVRLADAIITWRSEGEYSTRCSEIRAGCQKGWNNNGDSDDEREESREEYK